MNNPLRILQAVDAKLNEAIEFFLFGRAALVLGFADPPAEAAATQDVDGIIPRDLLAGLQTNEQWWAALQAANDELEAEGLYLTHLFDEEQIILRPDWREPPQQGADFGLVMQCGEQELFAVKQPPMDCNEQQSRISYQANAILIAHSLAGYLAHGFDGLFMPCNYIRAKEGGQFESGIAYFGYPSVEGCECQAFPYENSFDGQFGHGFTTMMTAFIRALQQSSRTTGITLSRRVGLDVRYRLELGSLGTAFLLVGSQIACLKTVVSEQDPVWTVLRATGISEAFHVPSLPAAIGEDELSVAKSATPQGS